MNDLTKRKAQDFELKETGLPKFSNIGDMLVFGESLLRSGMLPKSYKSASQVVVAMQMSLELGLNPGLASLRRITVINNTPTIFAEMPLAVCRKSKYFEDCEGFHFDLDFKKICFENKNLNKDVFGYFFKVKRKNQNWYEEYYTISQARKAGLGNVWNKHPEDMLKWRTIGKCLKVVFPDVLSCAPIAEYDFNTKPGCKKDISSKSIDNLNELLE